ncbi:hypothetical protein [Actinopolymorpha singaporensis]|nr:hypothetical protein [Actinopolymorpha singaporensis]
MSSNLVLRYPTADDLDALADLVGRAEYEPSLPWMFGLDGRPRWFWAR